MQAIRKADPNDESSPMMMPLNGEFESAMMASDGSSSTAVAGVTGVGQAFVARWCCRQTRGDDGFDV